MIGIDDQWDVDLLDMTKFSKYNRGYIYNSLFRGDRPSLGGENQI